LPHAPPARLTRCTRLPRASCVFTIYNRGPVHPALA
jgi:hypothetical protein